MNFLGNTFNGYKFIEVIGGGSFGTVYKVEKEGLTYAAKVFSDAYVKQEFKEEDNRIAREIAALKKTNGEELINYIDDFAVKGYNDEIFYVVVMEYFKGIDLQKYIKTLSSYNEQLILSIFDKILNGIKSLHESNIIHRDLKPENILINSELEIKIVDYGLSKLIDFSTLTQTGSSIGTPYYMSPEQFKDSKNVDERSDVFSLGVILYQMATNTLPFEDTTYPALMYKIISSPLPSPKTRNNQVSEHLEQVLYKATQKQNYNRYSSVDEFITSLHSSLSSTTDDVSNSSTFYPFILNDKSVLETYSKENDIKVIYQIHLKHWAKGVHNLVENASVDAIIDPSTHKLSYSKFMDTKGLVELPYAPSEGVISLQYLEDPANRINYIDNWYNHIENYNKVILPYHYASNSTYKQEDVDEWLRSNIQLIEEANVYLDEKKSNKTKYAMITLEFEHLVYEKSKILSYYTSVNVDYYIVQISDIKLNSPRALNEYINFIRELQQSTGKGVIALRIPVSLGLTLIANGIHGFSTGLASGENFKEDYIKNEDESTYAIYANYYIEELLALLSYVRKESYEFEKVYNHFYPNGCECKYCDNKEWNEIAMKKNRTIQLHYLTCIYKVVEDLNRFTDIGERKEYFKEMVANSLEAYKNIPKEIIRSPKNEKYKLLKNIYDII